MALAAGLYLCAVAGLWLLPQVMDLSAAAMVVHAAHLGAFLLALAAAPVVILGGLPRLPAEAPTEELNEVATRPRRADAA